MKSLEHRRHDISSRAWEILGLLLPGRKGAWELPAQDNSQFIKAVIRILRTGASRKDLLPVMVTENTHRRFTCWRDRGVWAKLFEFVQKILSLNGL